MIKGSDYQMIEEISRGKTSSVYRAKQLSNGKPVILKVLPYEHATLHERSRLLREYEILRDLDVPGVIKTYGIEDSGSSSILVLEDFGGESLARVVRARQLSVGEFLRIAMEIADAVRQIHDHGLMHKDINPSNIVWNSETGVLKLIDFGIAANLPRQAVAMVNPSMLEGTLAYVSPEQTGRMNRPIDYRTDIYSMGATFYELLTQEPPFDATDPMEIVHSHIAKTPNSPHTVRPGVPELVSDIIVRLMAKMPDARYQSATGVHADLRQCLTELETRGCVDPFQLGRHDIPTRFHIPQKLYGRENAIGTLLEAFERARAGSSEILLVTGNSGTGKSSLVHELHVPVASQNGHFASGKFEEFERTIPYAAIIRALQDLVRQVFTKNEEQIRLWRKKLLLALGLNGQLVLDVIPELELIVGPQPEVQSLPAAEEQQRFNLVFQNFVRTFGGESHPLVLFIDDLERADMPSLKLIERLAMDADAHHLLLVGAYRENEIDAAHPLTVTLAQLRKSPIAALQTIHLGPLEVGDVHQLVSDALRCELAESRPLAELCFDKTRGNPFFLTQFLSALWQGGMISFAPQLLRWTWDTKRIEQAQATDNVVELMISKLNALPSDTRDALQLAACIGNHFDLRTLANVGEQPEGGVARALRGVLAEGLIVPLDGRYKYGEQDQAPEHDGGRAPSAQYRFLHDRVQEAAAALMSDAQRTERHLKIGRLLYRNAGPKLEESIFEIVSHLNAGAAMMNDREEQFRLAKLNLIAGTKARRATAFQPAIDYLRRGVDLAGEDVWEREYPFAYDLFLNYADLLAICGHLDESRKAFTELIARARSAFEKVVAYEKLSEALSSAGKHAETFVCSREGLALYGVMFPDDREAVRTETEQRVRALLTRETLIRLAATPTAGEVEAVMGRFFDRLIIAAYVSAQEYLPLVICRNVEYALEHGLGPQSGTAVVWLAMLAWKSNPELCLEFGESSLQIMNRFDDPYYIARTVTMGVLQILGWKHSFRQSETVFTEAFLQCHKSGDLQYASYALLGKYVSSLVQGESCSQILEDCRKWRDYCEKYVPFQLGQARIRTHLLHRLMEIPSELDVEAILERYEKERNFTDVCESIVELVRISALFGEHEQGVRYAQRAEPLLEAGAGGTLLLRIMFWHSYSVCCARLYARTTDAHDKEFYRNKWTESLNQLRTWAELSPDNFAADCAFVEAEVARACGDWEGAVAKYVKAIVHSERHGYVLLQGASDEALGEMMSTHSANLAARHLLDAERLYLACGASAKAKAIRQKHSRLLGTDMAAAGNSITGTPPASTTDAHRLDWRTFAKASQTLSREILLPELLKQMLRIMMENAGAQRGVIILAQGGHWWVRAEANVEWADVRLYDALKLDSSDDSAQRLLGVSIVRSVIRTREAIVLRDAAREGIFRGDPYVRQRQAKSVLCLPIAHQGQCVGSVYLENNLTSDAFTPARVEVLSILSAQAAISMENARLYAESQIQLQKEQKLTEDLRRASRLKNEFLATVSHELRTPLNGIINLPRALLEHAYREIDVWQCSPCGTTFRWEGDSDGAEHAHRCPSCHAGLRRDRAVEVVGDVAEHRDMLRDLETSASHLAALVDELLDSANLEAGKLNVRLGRVDLGAVLDDVRTTMANATKGRDLRIAFPVLPAAIVFDGDAMRIKQVLINLLANATKVTSDGGRIDVQVEDGEEVVIRVKDTGVGIPSDALELIFESFRQVDGSHTRAHGGVGLGLSICRQLVELHGGRIWAESQLGVGSCFTAVFPRRHGAQTTHSGRESS